MSAGFARARVRNRAGEEGLGDERVSSVSDCIAPSRHLESIDVSIYVEYVECTPCWMGGC